MSTDDQIIMYGTDWCGDCHRSKATFRRLGVDFVYTNVDEDEAAKQRAIDLSGAQRIPVILFPDGDVLVEPSDPDLAAKIGAATT